MKRKLRTHHFIYLSAAACLVASTCALGQENLTTTISAAERILLGAPVNTGTVEERLSNVEQKLYGKPKKGPLLKRMQAVAEMLRIDSVPVTARTAGTKNTATGDIPVPSSQAAPQSPPVAESAPAAESLPPSQSAPARDPVSDSGPAAAPPSTPLMSYQAESENDQTDKDLPVKPPKWMGLLQPQERLGSQPLSPPRLAPAAGRPMARPSVSNQPNGRASLVELKPQAAKMDMPPLAPSIHRASPAAISAVPAQPGLSKQERAKNMLRQGLKLHAQGETGRAEGLFRRVLTIDPRNADAFFNLGSIAEARKDLVTALTDYRAALNLKPGEPDFQNAVAAVERELNENNDGLTTGEPSSQRITTPGLDGETTIAGSGSSLKPFQLQSTQNDTLLNAQSPTAVPLLNAQSPPAPSVNVGSPPATPMLNVTSANPSNRKLNAFFSVGSNILLNASGLHCPICRIMRGF